MRPVGQHLSILPASKPMLHHSGLCARTPCVAQIGVDICHCALLFFTYNFLEIQVVVLLAGVKMATFDILL